MPAHPLFVHVPIVLIPLTAIGAILVAAWPWFRRNVGWVVVGVGAVAMVTTWLAKESGERLSELVDESDALQRHETFGQLLLIVSLPMFALLVVYLAAELVQRRAGQSVPSGLAIVLAALLVLSSLVALVQVTIVGHSGAQAVWEDEDLRQDGGEVEDEDEEASVLRAPSEISAGVARSA